MSVKIYLVATTSLSAGMSEFLLDRGLTWDRGQVPSDAESLVEAAGRICYLSFGARQHRRDNAEYISNLVARGHDSVLEHANFTLLADGISRALSHQLVRHRIGFAYSQLSQQYKDESNAAFIRPPGLDEHEKLAGRWTRFMEEARSLYQDLVKDVDASNVLATKEERQRWLRSIARSVLPNAASTTLMITGNARAWRHLLDVRGSISGDWEMRDYCVAVLQALSASAPHLFSDYEILDAPQGRLVRNLKA